MVDAHIVGEGCVRERERSIPHGLQHTVGYEERAMTGVTGGAASGRLNSKEDSHGI
jgi:hypothetical protein